MFQATGQILQVFSVFFFSFHIGSQQCQRLRGAEASRTAREPGEIFNILLIICLVFLCFLKANAKVRLESLAFLAFAVLHAF